VSSLLAGKCDGNQLDRTNRQGQGIPQDIESNKEEDDKKEPLHYHSAERPRLFLQTDEMGFQQAGFIESGGGHKGALEWISSHPRQYHEKQADTLDKGYSCQEKSSTGFGG
jgi:hypothetical protein